MHERYFRRIFVLDARRYVWPNMFKERTYTSGTKSRDISRKWVNQKQLLSRSVTSYGL